MRVIHLAIRLSVYYLTLGAVVFIAATVIPGFRDYLPIGGAEELLTRVSTDPFTAIEIGAKNVENLQGSVLWLSLAIAGSLLTVLPLSWTYMAVRTQGEYDQSLVETIMILPIAVTGIVVIVSQSIALAFGLAGIVGGVRFRNTLKSSGDALYILTAIGIGLAAGVGALEIAVLMSIIFNYVFVWLWWVDFGGRKGAHRYMRLPGTQDLGQMMTNGRKETRKNGKRKGGD
jgi:hypothetical protein